MEDWKAYSGIRMDSYGRCSGGNLNSFSTQYSFQHGESSEGTVQKSK